MAFHTIVILEINQSINQSNLTRNCTKSLNENETKCMTNVIAVWQNDVW